MKFSRCKNSGSASPQLLLLFSSRSAVRATVTCERRNPHKQQLILSFFLFMQIRSRICCSVLVVLSFFFKMAALAAEEGVLEAGAAAGKLRCWGRWRDRGRWRGGRWEGRAKGNDSALFLVLANRRLEKGAAERERWQESGGCWTFGEDGWFGWPVVEAPVLSAEGGEGKVRVNRSRGEGG